MVKSNLHIWRHFCKNRDAVIDNLFFNFSILHTMLNNSSHRSAVLAVAALPNTNSAFMGSYWCKGCTKSFSFAIQSMCASMCSITDGGRKQKNAGTCELFKTLMLLICKGMYMGLFKQVFQCIYLPSDHLYMFVVSFHFTMYIENLQA